MTDLTPRQKTLKKYGKKKVLIISPIYLTDPDEIEGIKSDIDTITDGGDTKPALLALIRKEAKRLRKNK